MGAYNIYFMDPNQNDQEYVESPGEPESIERKNDNIYRSILQKQIEQGEKNEVSTII